MWALLFLTLQAATAHVGEDDVKTGAEYYRLRCAECHGDYGEGGRGPNLADGVYYHGGTDDDLLATIQNGIRGTEMPGFGNSRERHRQVVAFIRTLNQGAKPADVTGDRARGATLFRDKGDCLSCHRVGADGGFAGPDLSSIGSRRSLDYLKRSIVAPNDDVRRRYWVVTVNELGGARSMGFVLNEDRHSLQMLELEGRLRSFDKERLESIDRSESSLMQSYDGVFDETELDDLLAYLVSLRPGRKP